MCYNLSALVNDIKTKRELSEEYKITMVIQKKNIPM